MDERAVRTQRSRHGDHQRGATTSPTCEWGGARGACTSMASAMAVPPAADEPCQGDGGGRAGCTMPTRSLWTRGRRAAVIAATGAHELRPAAVNSPAEAGSSARAHECCGWARTHSTALPRRRAPGPTVAQVPAQNGGCPACANERKVPFHPDAPAQHSTASRIHRIQRCTNNLQPIALGCRRPWRGQSCQSK